MSEKDTDRKLVSTLARLAGMVEEATIVNAGAISEKHRTKADRVVEVSRMLTKKTMRLREAVK